jgi:hypothetical protein
MFAISLTLAIFFCTAVLLYQYWRGTLAPHDAEASTTPLQPDRRPERQHAPPPPARAA